MFELMMGKGDSRHCEHMRNRVWFALILVGSGVSCAGSNSDPSKNAGGATAADGGSSQGGATGSGGAASSGGQTSSPSGGHSTSTGGTAISVSTGGNRESGGAGVTGGATTAGGTSTGGVASGGTSTIIPRTGGSPGAGGASPTGGSKAAAGGETTFGGSNPTGGSTFLVTGGRSTSGGTASSGGTATSGGKTATSGGSTSGTYQPCPTDGSACKIMPLGDSITFGVGDENNGGYRWPLYSLAVTAGQKITFTGSLANGQSTISGQSFPQKNEGHSGWGISEVTPYSGNNAGIATVIPTPGFSTTSGGIPNIILLHIGTNDQGSLSASQMSTDLSGLIDKIITNAPNALIVVAQIIPLGYGTNAVIKAYNQAIPAIVQQRASAGKHITLVDMYTGFTPASMLGSDSIHPNTTGYKFMADHWYSIIGSMLSK